MRIISLLLLFCLGTLAEVRFPILNRPVIDEAGWLSAQEKTELENALVQFRSQGKGQLQVAIVDSLQGLPIENYAIKMVEQWKLGDQKRDDGVLFLASAQDRKMRIEVGQGLEGVLTDLQTKRILDDRVRPLFKSGDFAAGIVAGVAEIISTIDPSYSMAPLSRQGQRPRAAEGESGNSYVFWIILFLIIVSNIFGRGRRRSGLLPFLGGIMLGRHSGGGWSSGGGSSWGGGGGGFSGGGASSDW